MLIRVEASRLLIHRAVFNAANGLPDILESSTAKCFANEIAREVTTNAMQLMGGYGFNKEYKMERRVRDSFGWGIAGGTIDVQKVNIASAMIGQSLLKQYLLFEHQLFHQQFPNQKNL